MAKILVIEHDCGLLDAITIGLRKKDLQVDPICAQRPRDLLMEIAESVYEHRRHPEKGIILVSDYHLPGIKGIELIKYARDIAIYLGFRKISYGIMSSDHNIHHLPELTAIPVVRKDGGLKNIIGFVEELAVKNKVH